MERRSRIPWLAAAAFVAATILIAPRAGSHLISERVWVRPSARTIGYCTVNRFTGRLHGAVEVWKVPLGEPFAHGSFRGGRGVLSTFADLPATIEFPEWTARSLPTAIQSLENIAREWGRVEDPQGPPRGPGSDAPWIAAGISSEEWWASVSSE